MEHVNEDFVTRSRAHPRAEARVGGHPPPPAMSTSGRVPSLNHPRAHQTQLPLLPDQPTHTDRTPPSHSHVLPKDATDPPIPTSPPSQPAQPTTYHETPPRRPLNLCSLCNEDFTTVTGFDRHRVGKHAYTLTEGLKLDPPREDGRRCLDRDEMQAAGLSLDTYGRWRKQSLAGNPWRT